MLPFVFGDASWIYLGTAAVLGAVFLALGLALLRETTQARARSLFSFSLAYLALLFVAMAIDPIVLS